MNIRYPIFSFLILGYACILIFIASQDDKNCSNTIFTLKTNTISILIINILYLFYSSIRKKYNKYIHISKILIDSILSFYLLYNLIYGSCKTEVNLLWCWCLITFLFNIVNIIILLILTFIIFEKN